LVAHDFPLSESQSGFHQGQMACVGPFLFLVRFQGYLIAVASHQLRLVQYKTQASLEPDDVSVYGAALD
jgi:hypothetical protein